MAMCGTNTWGLTPAAQQPCVLSWVVSILWLITSHFLACMGLAEKNSLTFPWLPTHFLTLIPLGGWVSEWASEWVSERVSERASKRMSERAGEWASKHVGRENITVQSVLLAAKNGQSLPVYSCITEWVAWSMPAVLLTYSMACLTTATWPWCTHIFSWWQCCFCVVNIEPADALDTGEYCVWWCPGSWRRQAIIRHNIHPMKAVLSYISMVYCLSKTCLWQVIYNNLIIQGNLRYCM